MTVEPLRGGVDIDGLSPLPLDQFMRLAMRLQHLRHALPVDAVREHERAARLRRETRQHRLYGAGTGPGHHRGRIVVD